MLTIFQDKVDTGPLIKMIDKPDNIDMVDLIQNNDLIFECADNERLIPWKFIYFIA